MSAETGKRIKRSALKDEDRLNIAASLQLEMLDLIRQTQGDKSDLIFHGGTSIAYIHGSPRASEDLDFMATPEAVSRIFQRAPMLASMLQMKTSLNQPGAVVDFNIKKGEDCRIGDVAKINLRWEHPEYHGAVKVKVEFYMCPAEALEAYTAKRQDFSWRDKSFASPMQSATPQSIWADKILAMALRPVLKHRDIHDLGYITPMLPLDFNHEAYLEASMGIYGKEWADLAAGLERDVVIEHIHDKEAFLSDMERWFAPDEFAARRDAGAFDQLHADFLMQFETAQAVLKRRFDCGCQP